MNTASRRSFLKYVTLAGLAIPFSKAAMAFETGTGTYLQDLRNELRKQWPHNRTINLVFHGHSVPSGYFKTPDVNTLSAYPHLLLTKLKTQYPHAVINSIVTAIGGENSIQGAERFDAVLNHQPDVVFIDYALNDRGPGLSPAKNAWSQMIDKALKKNIKVILLTPSPDLKENILSGDAELKKHSAQIEALAKDFKIGLSDSYQAFQEIARHEKDLSDYMSQFNHPNKKGHQVIADRLFQYFQD